MTCLLQVDALASGFRGDKESRVRLERQPRCFALLGRNITMDQHRLGAGKKRTDPRNQHFLRGAVLSEKEHLRSRFIRLDLAQQLSAALPFGIDVKCFDLRDQPRERRRLRLEKRRRLASFSRDGC